MKKKIRRKLTAKKKKIEKQLADAVVPNIGRPVLQKTKAHYEISERTEAIGCGGIGAVHALVGHWRLAEQINKRLVLLKVHMPYHESDHVLNIAYNILCGGKTLDDIELRRNDESFLKALGTKSIPDPTTAGDFCRRFDANSVETLMEAINETRVEVWKRHPSLTQQIARIDADGTMARWLRQMESAKEGWTSPIKVYGVTIH